MFDTRKELIRLKRCVVYYSHTGNTKSVAEKIKNVDLLLIKPAVDDPNILNPTLVEIPDLSSYDHVIFATPVHGFQISKVMKTYLEQLPSLKGKTIDLFITHFFPFAWMGGNISLKQMKKIVESKEGVVRNMTSINWKNRNRVKTMNEMVEKYSA